jgi:uncharacterized protein
MYFEIYIQGNQYRWRLKAANHEIIASGEAYASKQHCIHAINLVAGSNGSPIHDRT